MSDGKVDRRTIECAGDLDLFAIDIIEEDNKGEGIL